MKKYLTGEETTKKKTFRHGFIQQTFILNTRKPLNVAIKSQNTVNVAI